jgi:UDP-galactopyranose mutase
MVHNYGPHAFRTNSLKLWEWLHKYSIFNDFELRVKARLRDGKIIPIPFNIQSMLELELPKMPGKEALVDNLFKDYSEKQWGMPFKELPASIRNRVPISRNSYDDRYCIKKYAGIPIGGYTRLFQKMLDHSNIDVSLNMNIDPDEFRGLTSTHPEILFVYTGKIDEYFNYCHGRLEYRSLNFVHSTMPKRMTPIINECNHNVEYTRTYDHSHFLKQNVQQTIITAEYPCKHDDTNIPMYPIPTQKNSTLYAKYKRMAAKEKNVMFIGRLAEYTYMDMDVAMLNVFKRLEDI